MNRQRVREEYSTARLKRIGAEQNVFRSELAVLELDAEERGVQLVYPNQDHTARQITDVLVYDLQIVFVMVIAQTQSGKTGVLLGVLQHYLQRCVMSTENVYILTGLSSRDWDRQTKSRFPPCIRSRIVHGDNIHKITHEIREKRNVLILIDEVQIACRELQRLHRAFRDAGLLDLDVLYERDIKIVQCSATPNEMLLDLDSELWKGATRKVKSDPGRGYIGCIELKQMGRVRQCKDLCGYLHKSRTVDLEQLNVMEIASYVWDNLREIQVEIRARYPTPRYHLIRTSTGSRQAITLWNFKRVFPEPHFGYLTYDSQSEVDINDILRDVPDRHTFIFVKEKLRCANTLVKLHLGIMYERYNETPDDSVVVQGLIGRDSGYDNNGVTLHYTNVDSIERYQALWESNFDPRSLWLVRSNKSRTVNNARHYDSDLSEDSEPEEAISSKHMVIVRRKTLEEIQDYFRTVLKPLLHNSRGPKQRKPDVNGFFLTNIRGQYRIFSVQELRRERKWGVGEMGEYRVHPCYRDPTDASTLEWWMIYYDFRLNNYITIEKSREVIDGEVIVYE
jgi:hypothetical protein